VEFETIIHIAQLDFCANFKSVILMGYPRSTSCYRPPPLLLLTLKSVDITILVIDKRVCIVYIIRSKERKRGEKHIYTPTRSTGQFSL
jgi:hypothetical protein